MMRLAELVLTLVLLRVPAYAADSLSPVRVRLSPLMKKNVRALFPTRR
jgi:hypothetical protein